MTVLSSMATIVLLVLTHGAHSLKEDVRAHFASNCNSLLARGALNSSCSTPCSSRKSVIVLENPPGVGAGIEDRGNILNRFSTYAEALCARLLVPKPCMLLGNHNNLNGKVSCDHGWGFYFDLGNGSRFIEENSKLVPGVSKTTPSLLGLESTFEHRLQGDLDTAFKLFAKGTPFFLRYEIVRIWEHIIPCDPVVTRLRESGCNHFQHQIPEGKEVIVGSPLVATTAEHMTRTVRGIFSVLHVRRGDLKDNSNCGTFLEDLRATLNDRLKEDPRVFDTIFLFTDETDEGYLSSVLVMLREFCRDSIHGDPAAAAQLAKEGISNPDNYLVYMVSNEVKALSVHGGGFSWKLGRGNCRSTSQPATAQVNTQLPTKPSQQISKPSSSGGGLGCGPNKFGGNVLCDPPCTLNQTKSIIFLYSDNGMAGIGDRTVIMELMARFAQTLCARVLLPPPNLVLGPSHNTNNTRLDCGSWWPRYVDWESMSAGPVNRGSLVEDWRDFGDEKFNFYRKGKNCDNEKKQMVALQGQISKLGLAPVDSLGGAYVSFARDIPFLLTKTMTQIWKEVVPDQACTEILHDIRTSNCVTARRVSSALVTSAGTEMVRGFKHYAILHLRRSDTRRWGCDNSPAAVKLFLNCQLGQYNGSFPAIFLFTDEIDPEYVSSIMTVMQLHSPYARRGDLLAAENLERLGVSRNLIDNYLVYMVFYALRVKYYAKDKRIMHLSMGGHDENTAKYCLKVTRCARNGNVVA